MINEESKTQLQLEHTPGPWRYEPETKTIRSVPANFWIATLDSWDGAVCHEANAQLIASAPQTAADYKDAIEALRQAKIYIEKAIETGAYESCVLPLGPSRFVPHLTALIQKYEAKE